MADTKRPLLLRLAERALLDPNRDKYPIVTQRLVPGASMGIGSMVLYWVIAAAIMLRIHFPRHRFGPPRVRVDTPTQRVFEIVVFLGLVVAFFCMIVSMWRRHARMPEAFKTKHLRFFLEGMAAQQWTEAWRRHSQFDGHTNDIGRHDTYVELAGLSTCLRFWPHTRYRRQGVQIDFAADTESSRAAGFVQEMAALVRALPGT